MYADVVVLTYQSPDINYFTYLVPKTLQSRVRVGQLVQVPFGKRQPFGIVLSIDNSQSTIVKNIKLLSSIVFPQPILLPYQIDLLKWMSFYYLAPMVNCLEAMLPTAALNAKRLLTNASGWQSWKGSRQRADSKQISDKSANELNRALAGGKRLTGPATNQVLVLIPTLNR